MPVQSTKRTTYNELFIVDQYIIHANKSRIVEETLNSQKNCDDSYKFRGTKILTKLSFKKKDVKDIYNNLKQ